MKKLYSFTLPVLLLLLASFVSCQKPEMTARDSLAAAKGAIQAAQAKYETTCKANPTLTPCVVINKAVAAQNTAIDALNLYCSGSGYAEGGPCNPSKEYEPRLKEALANLDLIIKEVEVLAR